MDGLETIMGFNPSANGSWGPSAIYHQGGVGYGFFYLDNENYYKNYWSLNSSPEKDDSPDKVPESWTRYSPPSALPVKDSVMELGDQDLRVLMKGIREEQVANKSAMNRLNGSMGRLNAMVNRLASESRSQKAELQSQKAKLEEAEAEILSLKAKIDENEGKIVELEGKSKHDVDMFPYTTISKLRAEIADLKAENDLQGLV